MFWSVLPSRFAGKLRTGQSRWDPWALHNYFTGVESGSYGAIMIWRGFREVPETSRLASLARSSCRPEYERWLSPARIARDSVTQWWSMRLGDGQLFVDIRCVLRGDPWSLAREEVGYLAPQPRKRA